MLTCQQIHAQWHHSADNHRLPSHQFIWLALSESSFRDSTPLTIGALANSLSFWPGSATFSPPTASSQPCDSGGSMTSPTIVPSLESLSLSCSADLASFPAPESPNPTAALAISNTLPACFPKLSPSFFGISISLKTGWPSTSPSLSSSTPLLSLPFPSFRAQPPLLASSCSSLSSPSNLTKSGLRYQIVS